MTLIDLKVTIKFTFSQISRRRLGLESRFFQRFNLSSHLHLCSTGLLLLKMSNFATFSWFSQFSQNPILDILSETAGPIFPKHSQDHLRNLLILSCSMRQSIIQANQLYKPINFYQNRSFSKMYNNSWTRCDISLTFETHLQEFSLSFCFMHKIW